MFKKVRKFPEAPDGKLELGLPKTDLRAREKNSSSFNSDRWIRKTYFLPLLVGKPYVRLAVRWFTLPPVSAVSEKHQMDLSSTTKSTEFGHMHPEATSGFQRHIWENRPFSNNQ